MVLNDLSCVRCGIRGLGHTFGKVWHPWGLAWVVSDLASPEDATTPGLFCPKCRKMLNQRALWRSLVIFALAVVTVLAIKRYYGYFFMY